MSKAASPRLQINAQNCVHCKNLRHQGSDAEHRLVCAGGRRRTELPRRHVTNGGGRSHDPGKAGAATIRTPAMPHRPTTTRATLLTLCLLSACAAADPADVSGPAGRPVSGASGRLLVARFAATGN